MKPLAILWDHDGTVVNSPPIVVAATNDVLRARGQRELPAPEIVAGMVLPTAPRMGRHARSDDPTLQAELAREYHLSAIRVGTDLATAYPGVCEVVRALTARSLPQGMVSNNTGVVVRRILEKLGIARHFGVAWGEEDVPAPKPDPRGIALAARALGREPRDCVYVSDGLTDIIAAHGAGMPIIGVTWGIHPREEMERADFDELVDTPQEVLELLTRT